VQTKYFNQETGGVELNKHQTAHILYFVYIHPCAPINSTV